MSTIQHPESSILAQIADLYQLSASSLLVYDLDLLVYYLPSKPIDGDMDPVMLFPFNHKIVLQASSVWFVVPALCNHIDQQVPRPRLRQGGNRSRNNFPSSLNSLIGL